MLHVLQTHMPTLCTNHICCYSLKEVITEELRSLLFVCFPSTFCRSFCRLSYKLVPQWQSRGGRPGRRDVHNPRLITVTKTPLPILSEKACGNFCGLRSNGVPVLSFPSVDIRRSSSMNHSAGLSSLKSLCGCLLCLELIFHEFTTKFSLTIPNRDTFNIQLTQKNTLYNSMSSHTHKD